MKQKSTAASPAGNQRRRAREISAILRKHGVIYGMSPEKLAALLVDLGPTFVKMGQLLSMRSDFLPAAYCRALEALRTHIDPIPYEEIKAAIEREYARDLDEVFSFFDSQPLGAASIAQVHRARVGQEEVAVKIQRPNLYETMFSDILLMKKAAKLISHTEAIGEEIDLNKVIDEMWAVTKREIDFRHEAANLKRFAVNSTDIRYVTSPRVYEALSTQKVLVMSFLDGIAIDDTAALEANGYHPDEIASKLADNFVQQVIDDGFFHADPHAGNIKIDAGRIVWLDLGMMGELNAWEKEQLSRIVEGFALQDHVLLLDAVLKLGTPLGDVDIGRLTRDLETLINKYTVGSVSSIDAAGFTIDLLEAVRANKISFPESLSTLGRGVSSLQSVLRLLDTDISLTQIIMNHASGYAMKRIDPREELTRLARAGHQAGGKLLKMPDQLSNALTLLEKGLTKVKMEHSLTRQMLGELDGMVCKLVMAIIAAALLISAGLVAAADIEPLALNIPVISLVGYLAAILLILKLLKADRKPKHRHGRAPVYPFERR